jgi:hypothetical protein
MSAAVLRFSPRIGRPWHGGVYAARIGDYNLIAGPPLDAPADWATATAWAADLHAYGHSDFTLPRVAELRALAATFPNFFRGTPPWWSCETHSQLPTDALVLHHEGSVVIHWVKHHRCHAIAVRRQPNDRR